MDRVRFGRVLGRGTRLAAKTLYEAVDAATSNPPAAPPVPRPSPAKQPVSSRTIGGWTIESTHVRRPAASPSLPAQRTAQRDSMLGPVKRASRAVSLEITGSFFALFALAFAVGAWHSRDALHAGGGPMYRWLLYCAVTLLFGYFSLSNFLKAKRLQ